MLQIPDKLYFKIGEVAALLQLKTHVLRYWETEFTLLQPIKSRSNQRLYRRKDVETALLIKELLYRQGFTIAGARKKLQSDKQLGLPLVSQQSPEDVLTEIKADLIQLRRYLLNPPPE
ncbi:MerR family transcriptional regulator [uncultured Desulfuromusa sp.]|uniref:MerR family transcriptional regulator n=1 Tax=uncultured Desulfuromusa sp. TaxID=219183 RepID=UPI002AA8691A|nr:MerR family transcriptional regulator [uncultured Desulfuromusa sp.]